jgi:hypothetical protein
MPHLTKAQWLEQLEDCGGDMTQDDLVKLVFNDGPNALWSDVVREMQLQYNSIYPYLTGFFPTRVLKDWNGVDELQRTYHSAFMPMDFSMFVRSMQNMFCDPSPNECHTDYCEIPQGGLTNIPPLEMWKWGLKTKPFCIANIRTSFAAKQIAEKIVRERFAADEQSMNAFYTMAVIRMLGHKWILEYEQQADGTIEPVANSNPYNILSGFRYNYMQPLFPQVGNLQNIMPFDFRFMDMFGRALTNSQNPNKIATGPRGEPIYEIWFPDDWYRQEVLDNPEYIEKCRYMMKTDMLPGYTLQPGEKEIIGNFSIRSMPMLPRFAESTKGGLTIVQTHKNVAVDGGNRAIHNNREWDNAPFYLVVSLGKGIGEILTRPALTVGVEGRPIMPITGDGDWVYRNDYDPVCNEDLNMPHFRKRYEMGFRLLNADAGWGFVARAKKFRLRAVNTCDLRPIIQVAPVSSDCSILSIGCNTDVVRRATNNIIQDSNIRHVACHAAMCGEETIYRLTINREALDSITPDQNPVNGCECGDEVNLILGDETGAINAQTTGTLVHYIRPNAVNPIWFVKLDAALDEGDCIRGIVCPDDTPDEATVVACVDTSQDAALAANRVRFIVDGMLSCDVGDAVTVTYYDEDGVSLGTEAGTIALFNAELMYYEITGTTFSCESAPDGTVTIKISCD